MAKKDFPLLVAFAFWGISLFYIAYQYAVKMSGAALASVLLYTAPAWVVICSYFLYREKLTLLKTVAVAMVITGVFLISKSGGNIQSRAARWISSAVGLVTLILPTANYLISFPGRSVNMILTRPNRNCWLFVRTQALNCSFKTKFYFRMQACSPKKGSP